MNMNSPVECRQFFSAESEEDQERLWCVILTFTGEILSVFETKPHPHDITHLHSLIQTEGRRPHPRQLLLIKTGIHRPSMYSRDWIRVDFVSELIADSNFSFCDYLILAKERVFSLMDHEEDLLIADQFSRPLQFPFDHSRSH